MLDPHPNKRSLNPCSFLVALQREGAQTGSAANEQTLAGDEPVVRRNQKHHGARHVIGPAEAFHRQRLRNGFRFVAVLRDDLGKHVGNDRPRRYGVYRDAVLAQLHCPGSDEADLTGLGRRVRRPRLQSEHRPGPNDDEAPERRGLHCIQHALYQRNTGLEVQTHEVVHVLQIDAFDQAWPYHAGVVNQRRDVVRGGQLLDRSLGRRDIGKIDRMIDQPRMASRRLAARQIQHGVPRVEQMLSDARTDPGASARNERRLLHRRGAHGAPRSTSASTRSGLPEPFLIFNGGQTSIAPVAGTLSRLARHCSP